MIQTSIEPDSLAGVEPLCVELFELLSPPPQAATIRLATHSAASNHFDVFTVPPRSSPVRARTRTAAAPDTATPLPLKRRRPRAVRSALADGSYLNGLSARAEAPSRAGIGLLGGMSLPAGASQGGRKPRHEPVSVSSIDRPDELHHLPRVARAGPFEE